MIYRFCTKNCDFSLIFKNLFSINKFHVYKKKFLNFFFVHYYKYMLYNYSKRMDITSKIVYINEINH